jgi:hypothetical protein
MHYNALGAVPTLLSGGKEVGHGKCRIRHRIILPKRSNSQSVVLSYAYMDYSQLVLR